MSNTYSLEIQTLLVANENGLTDVVKRILWRYTATDPYNNIADMTGFYDLNSPDPLTFVQFSALTKEQVQNWVTSELDFTGVQAELDYRLSAAQAVQFGPQPKDLPW